MMPSYACYDCHLQKTKCNLFQAMSNLLRLQPLTKMENMVFVGSGNSGGGPSNFSKEMTRMVAEVPETVHALTGFDMRQGIANFVVGKTRGNVTE